jgi:hypothetical protein
LKVVLHKLFFLDATKTYLLSLTLLFEKELE